MYDLRPFLQSVAEILNSHRLASPGAYRRWLWQLAGPQRDLGLNPYGCADAANILYTLGRFPGEPVERRAWVETLQSLQEPGSGLYRELTHHPIHTTAHCLAALELFDARPLQPLRELAPFKDPARLERFLDELDWAGNPWNASHQGAGLYVSLVLAGEVDLAWQERYFAWLWEQADPRTGFFRQGYVEPVEAGGCVSLFPHLAGTFHYLFNLEFARRPLRYPERVVETCLEIARQQVFPLGQAVGFAEIDWVYCLTRSLRQSGHRFKEARQALADFADRFLPFLLGLDPQTDEGLNDLHRLFGALCCLAELQTALPGQIISERPLKLVLDRRPFI